MKKSDLGIKSPTYYIQKFFIEYLQGELHVSQHTIRSYRDMFVSYLNFHVKQKNLNVNSFGMNIFNREDIVDYLKCLQDTSCNSVRTRNQRLCALKTFSRFLKYEVPQMMNTWDAISSIKNQKECKGEIRYLTVDALKIMFDQVPTDTQKGRRDLVLLMLLYRTAVRASELVKLTPYAIRLTKPEIIEVLGKGNKKRIIPLDDNMVELLRQYMDEYGLSKYGKEHHPLFFNSRGEALTTAGIAYVLKKYFLMARGINPSLFPEKFSPHSMRSTKAMHWLQAGLDLYYIKDLLGHSSIQTTEIYARADGKAKRDALEKVYDQDVTKKNVIPKWHQQPKLLDYLKSLSSVAR